MIKYCLRSLIIGLGLSCYLRHVLVTSVRIEEEETVEVMEGRAFITCKQKEQSVTHHPIIQRVKSQPSAFTHPHISAI